MDMKKRGCFTLIPNEIIVNEKISDAAFRTYVVLRSFKFGDGKVFPSQKTLSRLRARSVRAICGHLKLLKDLGVISFKQRGYSSSNIYTFYDAKDCTSYWKKLSSLGLRKLPPNNTKISNTKIKNLRDFSYKRINLSATQQLLVNKIVKWCTRPQFNTRLPEKTVRIMVERTVKRYGEEAVSEIYEKTANKALSPHPMHFWKSVSDLKKGGG